MCLGNLPSLTVGLLTRQSKAASPLRSAAALQMMPQAFNRSTFYLRNVNKRRDSGVSNSKTNSRDRAVVIV